ncbi:MAG TPA: hypothetical protein VMU17_03830, partial [Elusimicrobiota bacterium]|nr:hypothetical protein [Elusimicrobiota bacterium]
RLTRKDIEALRQTVNVLTIRMNAEGPPNPLELAFQPADPDRINGISELQGLDVLKAWELTDDSSMQRFLHDIALVGSEHVTIRRGSIRIKNPYRLKLKTKGTVGGESYFDVTDREAFFRKGDLLFLVNEPRKAPPRSYDPPGWSPRRWHGHRWSRVIKGIMFFATTAQRILARLVGLSQNTFSLHRRFAVAA